MGHNTAQRGFTLPEMMATLAVTAIITSLAVPSMKNIVDSNKRTTGTNELVATIHAARSAAITRNLQVTICPSSDAMSCNEGRWQDGIIYFTDNNQDRKVSADDEILGTVNGIADITIRSQDFEQFLAFRPNGQIMVNTIAENSGEILLCDDRGAELSRSLILHVGGKPQIAVNTAPGAYAACLNS
jgi:type IV fimbrial biogenesis protein FimT